MVAFVRKCLKLLKASYLAWSEDRAGESAAAVAFYTVFSFAPLVVIIVGVFGLVMDSKQLQNELLDRMDSLIGSNGTDWLRTVLQHMASQKQNLIAAIIGVVILLVGATTVFAQIQSTVNRMWKVEAKPGENILAFLRVRLLSLGLILAIGFLLLVSLVADTLISLFSRYFTERIAGLDGLAHIVNEVVFFILISFLFAAIFKYLPDTKITWKNVRVGAILTAFLFTIGKVLIGLYLGKSAVMSTYGAAGSLVVLLLWVYYSSQILFFGAEFTQVQTKQTLLIQQQNAETRK